MKMKSLLNHKSLLALTITAMLSAGSALASTTSGGTVNFNGKLVTSACAISANSANIDVDMGEVRTAALVAAGSETSSAKAFSITLEDCDISASNTVAVTFSGTPDTSDADSLAAGSNGGSGSAQNVAIRLYDELGNLVRLGDPAAAVSLRNGANTLNFSAKYYSPLGNATAGDASAVATYTVTYS